MEITDATMIHFLLLKHKDDPLHEYVKKLKTAKEVAESHLGGPIILSKYMKTLKDYDEKDNKKVKELQEKSWEKFCAHNFFLKNANNLKYGIGKVKATHGSKHNYLGMNLEFSENRELIVDMKEYIEEMLQEFPIPKNYNSKTPWNDQLFKIDENSPKLKLQQQKLFHRIVMKGIFLMKRGQPDIGPGISFLSTRVTKPNYEDWKKLTKMMSFLKNTKNDLLTLHADDTQSIHLIEYCGYATIKDERNS